MWEPSGVEVGEGSLLRIRGFGVSGRKVGDGHLESLLKCEVEVSSGDVWVGSGHGGHREGGGGLYQDGGAPPSGPIVVSSDVCSKALRSD